MSVNVGKALLHYSKNRRFQFTGQAAEIVGQIQVNDDLASLCKSLYIPLESGRKTRVIKKRRMKEMRDCSNLFGHFLNKALTVAECMCGICEPFDVRPNRSQVHSQGSQRLPNAVVQFASD